jgi:prepilin-type N-terminal cleavage/methylation domain-containing protein
MMIFNYHAMRRPDCERQGKGRRAWPSAKLQTRGAGFTFIELLISMSIMLILAGLTLRMVYTTLDSDRLSTGSRELQSFLAGARDRAAYAGQPRGVRFIPDKTDSSTASNFVYVGAPTNYSDGTITVVDAGAGQPSYLGTPWTATSWPATWGPQAVTGVIGFRDRGLLSDGSRIKIPGNSTGQWYTLAYDTNNARWGLTTRYAGGTFGQLTYTLELAGAVLPGDQPRTLPQGVVVDLDNSVLPAAWGTSSPYTTPLDILFSPQGNVIGPPASDGRIHFVLSAIADVTGDAPIASLPTRNRLNAPWQAGHSYAVGNVIVPAPSSFLAFRCTTGGTSGGTQPAWPTQLNATVPPDNGVVWQLFVKKTNSIISVATTTGRVTTHPVDVATPLSPGPGYDSFRFAEIGEVTQ